MAFIPINAKADINGSKKGKLTPAQYAQVNAFSLSQKTGIFDAPNKCEATVNTPIGGAAEVVFQKGYLAICGRIVEVEEGSTVSVPIPVYGEEKVSGRIVAGFYLSSEGENEFKVFATQNQPIKQDLNDYPTSGTYELVLYEYEATPNGVTLLDRQPTDYIRPNTSPSTATWFNGSPSAPLYDPTQEGKETKWVNNIRTMFKYIFNDGFKTGSSDYAPEQSHAESFVKAPLSNYDVSKGTIEERLSRLGFSEGSVSAPFDYTTLKKMGNYAIWEIPANRLLPSFIGGFEQVELSFKSKNTFTTAIPVTYGQYEYGIVATFTADSNIVTLEKGLTNTSAKTRYGSIGFEISAYKDEQGNWVELYE